MYDQLLINKITQQNAQILSTEQANVTWKTHVVATHELHEIICCYLYFIFHIAFACFMDHGIYEDVTIFKHYLRCKLDVVLKIISSRKTVQG